MSFSPSVASSFGSCKLASLEIFFSVSFFRLIFSRQQLGLALITAVYIAGWTGMGSKVSFDIAVRFSPSTGRRYTALHILPRRRLLCIDAGRRSPAAVSLKKFPAIVWFQRAQLNVRGLSVSSHPFTKMRVITTATFWRIYARLDVNSRERRNPVC